MNVRLGYRLLRDHRVPIRAKLRALGIGAARASASSSCCKWIRIICACWKANKPYDESFYLKALAG